MKAGFTLIEMIAVLLLLGILAVATTVSFLPVAEGLAQVRTSSTAMQKSRLAFARLFREITTLSQAISGDSQYLEYVFREPITGVERQRVLRWSGTPGDPLLLNDLPLTDDVADFQLQYLQADGTSFATWADTCHLIEISLRSQTGPDIFRVRIAPRNFLFREQEDEGEAGGGRGI